MDEEKEKIRKTISSILLSTPLTLTIGQLIKDYRDAIGTNIPFQKFGYKSVEQFLRSISAFEIYGQGSGAQIKAKVTSKAAHIDKLVVRQKYNVPKTRKKISRPAIRRYQATPLPVEQPNFSSNSSSRTSQHQNVLSPSVQEKEDLPSTFSEQQYQSVTQSETINQQNLYKKQNHQNVSPPHRENAFSFPCSSRANPIQGINLPPYLETSQSKSKFRTNKPKFVPPQIEKRCNSNLLNKSNTEIENQWQSTASKNSEVTELSSTSGNVCLENYFSSLSDDIKTTAKGAAANLSSKSISLDDVFVSDSEDEDYINYKVPAEVQQNLCILIKNYQDGLWCNELPNAYKRRFRKTLDYMDYGYKTLMALCMDLDRIFHCIRPDRGDIKLYDKSKPLPLNAANSLHFTDLLKNTEMVDYPKDNALPDVSDVIMYRKQSELPPDVVHLFEELPRQWISEDIKLMSFIDIDVGEIYDPSKFWIILRGPETSQKLDAMMDEMQEFYTAHRELQIPEKKLELGLYCAALILGEYHRGIITHLMPHVEGQVKEQIPVELPPNEEPNVRFIHLFPSFDELEQGLVPTATQMERMLETGVELHHIYPWYYKKSIDLEDFAEWPKTIPEKRESTTNISRYMKLATEGGEEEDLMNFAANQQFLNNHPEPLIDLMSSYDCGTNSYENIVNATSSYNFPVLTPEVLSTKVENNYNTNSSFSKMNTEVSESSNFDFKSDNRKLPHFDSNLDEIKKQTEADSFSNKFENSFAFGAFAYNTNLTTSIESHLDAVKNETKADNLSFTNSLDVHKDNFLTGEPLYKLTTSYSNLQKNDKKENAGLTDLSSTFNSSEKNKSPESCNDSLKIKLVSPKLDKSKKKKKSGKKTENNVCQTNTTENTCSESSITLPKIIRPPPGFEGNLNVTSNNTQNVIPSVQQNFINVYLGNLQPALSATVPTFYPCNFGPMGVAPNLLQQQVLLQGMLQNQMIIENFQRQQQMIMQQEQNKNIVADQMALLQQMASQLNLSSDKDNCKVITTHKKMVMKIDFYKKTLHLIRYTNEIYCSVQEVQKVFFGDKWPIIKLKRHIAVTNPSIRIDNFHKNECIELTQELLQANVVTEEEMSASMCLLHLVTFKDLPNLINTVSHSKLEFPNFDKYLMKYDYNSEAWL